ncbi:hypothetical protein ACYFX5_09085 [Bremerella sp. T1]|uniref:hypothetical protein n=1 Tax=Bremerella sp. TYQ1 TaxID=3119568 RepID=UPI001CCE9CE4|nr:hypothetical protein [Bremerella volcania]UBM38406.1 hypothetical protein LA756_11015 [Bremerella volcania]
MTQAPKISKADAIRSHLETNPDASPTTIAKALRKAGYKDLTPQYVSTIKSMDKRKSAGTSRRGPLTGDDLIATKEFVAKLGGLERAKHSIEMLQKLN